VRLKNGFNQMVPGHARPLSLTVRRDEAATKAMRVRIDRPCHLNDELNEPRRCRPFVSRFEFPASARNSGDVPLS
jgi:hypothetical protein